ncbi:MAG: Rpn family recombination-promoting nuclease/putative transposase, partial [Solobacterium sp.]|nr:Rpn family recombination-promoting nuclease/putative transposase [Solobacterium sp.]
MAKMIQMPQSIQAPTGEQRWMYANFTDSFVFTYIMTTRMDIAKQILVRIMPELENDEIRSIRQEYRLGNAKPEKHIISDIMIRTESGRIIVIEMQNRPLPYLKKRARGYTAVIDSVLLKKGDEKYDLPDVTLIIICGFDPADRQRYVNDQVSYYRTDPDIETDDGRKVIWLNPKGRKGPVTPELKAFLDYVNGIEVDDELCDNIDRAVLEMKRSYIIRREYMFFTD